MYRKSCVAVTVALLLKEGVELGELSAAYHVTLLCFAISFSFSDSPATVWLETTLSHCIYVASETLCPFFPQTSMPRHSDPKLLPYHTFSNTEYVDQRTPALPKVMTDDGMLFICRELKKYVLRLKISCDHTRRRFLMHDTMHTIIRTQNDSLKRRLEQQERQCLGKVSYRFVG
jgi:hypothetical protein